MSAVLRIECDAPGPALSESTISVLASIEAEERLLSDMDTYCDWLYAQCLGAKPERCRIGAIPSDPGRFDRFVDSLDVPQLQALSLYPRAEVAFAATSALRDKFIAAHGDMLARLASEVEID